MKRYLPLLLLLAVLPLSCTRTQLPEELDDSYTPVPIQSSVNSVQPSTGLVLWSENARNRHNSYGKSISLEYAYCLPCQVVTGKDNGQIRYDWHSFNSWLKDVASRGHQAVVRFRYEYPGETLLVFVDQVTDGYDVTIESDHILPSQKIQFDANL